MSSRKIRYSLRCRYQVQNESNKGWKPRKQRQSTGPNFLVHFSKHIVANRSENQSMPLGGSLNHDNLGFHKTVVMKYRLIVLSRRWQFDGLDAASV